MGIQIGVGKTRPEVIEPMAIGEGVCGLASAEPAGKRLGLGQGSGSARTKVKSGQGSRLRPSFGGLCRTIHRDYRRYRATGAQNALAVIALTQGFWASAAFRLSHWALARFQRRPLGTVVKAACLCLQKLIEVTTGICIPADAQIGEGLYIGHFGNIIVDSQCHLGENCNLSQGVTIGKGGRGELEGVPVLGDRVHVGANAILLGKITVGDDAVIGPGAVVMSSVPACGVAMGNPARVVGLSGSFGLVKYDEMESDRARDQALQNAQLREH